MQDIRFILSENQEINSILYNPINATHRIKYTCIAVSSNLIVLGSTSGSLYLFKREPCTFHQLIPLSEGAVSRVEISPDEKTIALGTIRGNVCLVTFKPVIKLIAVSNEHSGEKITNLCWNDNSSELYIGDGIGKVSVMVLSFFTVNGMFQAPNCTLMQLDSSIVQLSFSAPLLLISTLTRCYICDTNLEHYKQVGNKTRDGEYGACFLKRPHDGEKSSKTVEEETISRRRTFSLNTDSENSILNENHFKIYCARPSSRLWEVTTNGVVIKTHQFKEALTIPPLPVYKNSKTLRVDNDRSWLPQSLMFSQLSSMNGEFLFAFTSNGLYILDPLNASVILWNDEFSVTEAHVINNEIYLITDSGKFHCLTLCTIDSLIVALYDRKLYQDCLQVSSTFRSRILKVLANDNDDDDNDDNDDGESISNRQESDFFDLEPKSESCAIREILPLVSILRSTLNQPKKLESGIVLVNSGSSKSSPEPSGSFKGSPEIFEKQDNEDDLICNYLESTSEEIVVRNEKERKSEKKKEEKTDRKETVLHETMCVLQMELKSLHRLVESLKFTSDNEEEIEQILIKVADMIKEIKNRYEEPEELRRLCFEMIRAAELQSNKSLLEYVPIDLLISTNNETILKEILRIFIDINSSSRNDCATCAFPQPTMSRAKEPKFLEMGSLLLKKFQNEHNECLKICDNVPFMWREFLPLYMENFPNEEARMKILSALLQTKDSVAASILLPHLTEREWRKVNEVLRKIEKGICLSCGDSQGEREIEKFIDWERVTHEILKKDGPDVTLAFLFKAEKFIRDLQLDANVYQTIIFAKIFEKNGIKCNLDFSRNQSEDAEYMSMCSPKVQEDLMKSLENDLKQTVESSAFGAGPHHWGIRYSPKFSTCPCCTLSLQTPVLLGNNGIALFPCGHAYHVNCMIQKKISRCGLH
ncbi:Hermansky-Pudlak syndrome 5 protein homolog isoform X1 [Leptopilina heterotoma]|uniref:Hermansky-Pudlak syndrome 5 protein homolog isoform X1 n=1 Tax=Leptopilina heterotoma TaxID=63436 RepID=UPI001CA9C05E|nr:Hermansky-Pudlak syndrome 5 protein homolog isoform X1 [Leptopilina heterotoma]